MGRLYTAVFEAVAITVVQDLFQITMAAAVNARLHHLYLHQTNLTVQEILSIKIHRGSTNGSGGGTNPIGRATITGPHLGNSDATVEINNTTQSTEGDILLLRGWNVLVDFEWLATPDFQIGIPGSGQLNIELNHAPDASMTASGEVGWEEEG